MGKKHRHSEVDLMVKVSARYDRIPPELRDAALARARQRTERMSKSATDEAAVKWGVLNKLLA